MTPAAAPLLVRSLGLRPYHAAWRAMRHFTDARGPSTPDELWLLQHPPVYTLGQAGRAVHVRDPGGIEVVASDRGGQVTYHGPGQLVGYLLLDLRRTGLGVRRLVTVLEDAVIALLQEYGVAAEGRRDAPGVYVQGAKVAALGLRVRKGCCYHGLALNVDMDLEPFGRIDPCGYPGLPVTQLRDVGIRLSVDEAGARLAALLAHSLGLFPQLPAAGGGAGAGAADAYTL